MAARKARVGSGKSGRNPRVRPVPEPELSRMSVGCTGKVSRGGRVAKGDGRAATVSVGVEAGELRVLTVEVRWGKTCYERLARGQEAKSREGGTWGQR